MLKEAEFQPLLKLSRRLSHFGSALALLSWDQETLMPDGGTTARAGAIGELTEFIHRLTISKEMEEAIAQAEAGAKRTGDARAVAIVREAQRVYRRKKNVPAELAEEIARTSSESLPAWKEARKQNEFARFLPYLEKMFTLRKREAEAIHGSTGGRNGLYDAMLEEYEPGATSAELDRHIASVKPPLVALLREIAPRSSRLPAKTLDGTYSKSAQERFGRVVLEKMGFDFERGRIDVSAHPFCSGIHSPGDVRLTTRYNERRFEGAIFGLIHEAGHGLYEQGLDAAWQGTPLCGAVSMGIHESQSRLWENIVARGRPFWRHFYPSFRAEFNGTLTKVNEEMFVRAINRVTPSLIRVEADEVTYNLHIMLRYELEKSLLGGALSPAELPGRWNDLMEDYLGIVPPNDSDGCLQDIHWSFGLVGYFPTYFLGNLYAAQFYQSAQRALPGLEEGFAAGCFTPLRAWLEKEIHRRGTLLTAGELCKTVTGKELDGSIFIDYLTKKMREIHA